jgi:MYXO-CTERM domain-containing protein
MNHLDYPQPTASAPSLGALASRRASPARSAPSPWLPRAWLLSLDLLGVAVAEPAWAAQAENCNLDCPLGTTCELAPVACPAIACAEDSPDCPRCDSTADGTPYCAPAACESDSECSDSMKCAEFVIECANGLPLAAPARVGEEPRTNLPEPPPCEATVFRQCTPRWQLPCTADSDCGEGFRCEESESCSVPPSDPSSGEPQSSDVTCTPSGFFACVVVETACSTEADCPADFACVNNPNGTCSSGRDGQTQCTPVDPPQVCAPPAVITPALGNLASASSAESSSPVPTGDDVGGPEASATGGCTLNGATPASPLALLSTLGLGLAFGARRRRHRSL